MCNPGPSSIRRYVILRLTSRHPFLDLAGAAGISSQYPQLLHQARLD
jgi:hypothetical protein